MEIKSKIYGTPLYKATRISWWKRNGVVCDDFDMLYQEYIKTTNCQHCGKEFKSTKDRHLDHNHETGEFRLIVCLKCNVLDSYIKYPSGYNRTHNRKLYDKEYKQTHKDSIKEKNKIYREAHKEHLSKYIKQYYKEHPEKLVEKRLGDAKPIECECGVFIRRDSMLKHIKRNNHFNPFLDYPKYNIFV